MPSQAPKLKRGNKRCKKLDMSGQNCPVPVLRMKEMLAEMKSGEMVHVVATDPCSKNNVLAFIRITGDQLVEMREEAGEFHYHIRKA